jgi:hypothetical protein
MPLVVTGEVGIYWNKFGERYADTVNKQLQKDTSLLQLHCGYYLYNDKIYIDRKDLLDEMLVTRDNNSVQFMFNEDVFQKIDWTVEPDISLDELYRQRAQQIRDSYDYIILSYSGGADSHEVLSVFLKNNIFIDEIQVVHHYDLIKKIGRTTMETDPGLAMMLEFERVALPTIKKLVEKSPGTKINLMDASDFVVQDVHGHRFSFMGMDKFNNNAGFMCMTTPFVRNFFQHHQNNKNLNLGGKKVCFLRGTEKPSLKMYRNNLKFNFTDASMHGTKLMQKGDIDEIYTIENFFWSPDAPLIPIKQSHVIKKVLERDPKFYAQFMINQEKNIRMTEFNKPGIAEEQDFQRKYTRIIYSHWNDTFFKAPKKAPVSGEFQAVKILFNDTYYRDAIKEQNNFFFKKYDLIEDKSLLNKTLASYRYDLGEMNVQWND